MVVNLLDIAKIKVNYPLPPRRRMELDLEIRGEISPKYLHILVPCKISS